MTLLMRLSTWVVLVSSINELGIGELMWTDRVSAEMMDVAYRASATAEPAWQRSDAVRVLAELLELRIPVVGVEVWVPTTPGPTIPTAPYYGVSIERSNGTRDH